MLEVSVPSPSSVVSPHGDDLEEGQRWMCLLGKCFQGKCVASLAGSHGFLLSVWERSEAFWRKKQQKQQKQKPHKSEFAPGCLSKAPEPARVVLASACPVRGRLRKAALRGWTCQKCVVLPVGRWLCLLGLPAAPVPGGAAALRPSGGSDRICQAAPSGKAGREEMLCPPDQRGSERFEKLEAKQVAQRHQPEVFLFFLCFRNFNSLSKENVYENNKLVSGF